MAKTTTKPATKAATKPAPKRNPNMPDGFEPLGMTRADGFFVRETGNSVTGFLRDSFETRSKFGARKVYKIEVSQGTCRVMTADGEVAEMGQGKTVAIDETGYLKKLADLERGREVFIECQGKDDENDRQSPWIFDIGVVPF